MSAWLAALGPCASPKSKAKERNKGNSLPVNLSSLQRRGSLTDIRNTRKVTSQRSFREKLHDTFDGSLRRAKKAGSLEAMAHGGHTISNPDTNMNLATSLSPKAYGSVRVQGSGSEQGSPSTHEKFWTNFYNTLPRNRQRGDRPKDLSLQDLPVTERTDGEGQERVDSQPQSLSPTEGNPQWQVYATSPRTKRKNRSLERMNSAPSTRRSPMRRDHYDENLPGSDGRASPQVVDGPVEIFDTGTGSAFVVMPRSVSLQEEYWVPGTKGAHKRDLRKVSPSPERIIISQGHSPLGSPVQVKGHVWVKTKDGSHLELRPVEPVPRDLPSPSESQKTDMSSLSYITADSSLSSQHSPIQKQMPHNLEHPYLGPYLTPEEYQANIFDLIQSLNQAPQNPGSPQEKQMASLEHRGTVEGQEHKTYHTEKFIVLGTGDKEPATSKQDGGSFEKREQPIFSVRAHVFQIDPETKKNWIPASKTAVAVSYYYDSARHTYRIISVEGSKAIINSTITPNMAFTKTSQKFGQWSDPRANTVYGLGFGSESDLAKFIEKFKEVKDLTRNQVLHNQSPITVNGSDDSAQSTPRDTSSSGQPNRGFFHTRSSSLTSMRDTGQKEEQKDSVNLRERRNSFNTSGTNGNSPESQLKYENDKLKLALAQSSANAKKWEIELQTLKNNNARLTAALQESTANVEEWKRQLAAYKDESSRMKKKVSELEKQTSSSDQVVTLEEEIDKLSDRVGTLQRDNQYKDEEVDRLQQRLAEMNAKEAANGSLQSKIKVGPLFRSSSMSKRIKNLEEENKTLTSKVEELQNLLQNQRTSQDRETQEMLQLHNQLGSKITDLYEFHEQIVSTLRKESNS